VTINNAKTGDKLTARELDVLQGVIHHGSNIKGLAEAFLLTEYTIKSHLSSIYIKMNVHNVADAVVKGLSY